MAAHIRKQHHAATLGIVFLGLGAWCLYDAYEGRGRERPFLMRFLGSWG